MKVDRVIIALNNNEMYTPFWNAFSPVWRDLYDVNPTLVFVGSSSELKHSGVNTKLGDVLLVEPDRDSSVGEPDWSITWAFFWAASQFPDDVCMTHGADQLPLSDYFFRQLVGIDRSNYVIGLADAYEKYSPSTLGYFNTVSNVTFPTSHHVALGRTYTEIYKLEKSWKDEVSKVFGMRGSFHLTNKVHAKSPLWGLDECYSSLVLSEFQNRARLSFLKFFWKYWEPNRIDRGGLNLNYDDTRLRNGGYSEFHAPRPFKKWQGYIEGLIRCLLN